MINLQLDLQSHKNSVFMRGVPVPATKKAVLYGLLFSLGREERSPTPATKEAILRSSAG